MSPILNGGNASHTFVKKGVMKTKKTSYTSRRLRRITQIYEVMREKIINSRTTKTYFNITAVLNNNHIYDQ